MILSNAIAGATMQPYPFNMDKLVGASTNEYVGCAFELFEARVRQLPGTPAPLATCPRTTLPSIRDPGHVLTSPRVWPNASAQGWQGGGESESDSAARDHRFSTARCATARTHCARAHPAVNSFAQYA